MTGATGDTTTTDSRSQRNRASRRGGQLLTRARGSSYASACPHLRAPGASVPMVALYATILNIAAEHRHRQISYRLLMPLIIPGTVMSRRVRSSLAAKASITRVISTMRSSLYPKSSNSRQSVHLIIGVRSLPSLANTRGKSALNLPIAWWIAIPWVAAKTFGLGCGEAPEYQPGLLTQPRRSALTALSPLRQSTPRR